MLVPSISPVSSQPCRSLSISLSYIIHPSTHNSWIQQILSTINPFIHSLFLYSSIHSFINIINPDIQGIQKILCVFKNFQTLVDENVQTMVVAVKRESCPTPISWGWFGVNRKKKHFYLFHLSWLLVACSLRFLAASSLCSGIIREIEY